MSEMVERVAREILGVVAVRSLWPEPGTLDADVAREIARAAIIEAMSNPTKEMSLAVASIFESNSYLAGEVALETAMEIALKEPATAP